MLRELYTPRAQMPGGVSWEVYPRPQMRRDSFFNLNGQWDFAVTTKEQLPRNYDMTIRVPFCPESALSGIGQHFPEGSRLCYRRRFCLPEGFQKEKVLLHIGAADQICQVWVNGQMVCRHTGGYDAFCVDITHALQPENELLIVVSDDLNQKQIPYGKQTMKRGGMWYTPVSGIWQTVWLESVPDTYIEKLHIENRGAGVVISTEPALEGIVTVENLGTFPLTRGKAVINPENPHFWSPEDPFLYTFTVETGDDAVSAYFAIRTLQTKVIGGIPRLCLNGKPYFFHGLLDQGYWPDGLFTPAHPECYADDILAMKKLGFNTLRKHIKVEPEEFYYQCDKLGMIVFQDMVNNADYSFLRDTALPGIGLQKRSDRHMHKDPVSRECFLSGMKTTVAQLKNHPCIVYWTIFNEGWGQFDSHSVYEQLKALDDTRFIDSTSGWFRQEKSDVESLHIYFGSWGQLKRYQKPLVLSEFGGYTCPVEGHLFHPEKAYGYRTCKNIAAYQAALEQLYRKRILPAVKKGLCAAIYTQVSDVEDEINGLLTYDRFVCKADEAAMQRLAEDLQAAIQ